MRLTNYTDYALRSLVFLGLRRGESVTIPDIAVAFDISENHLRKVIRSLSQAGLVETTRGRNGGLRLGKAPEQIRIGSVVRMMEEDFSLVHCMGSGFCRIQGVCRLQGFFIEALEAWFTVLDGYTLADALKNPSGMIRRLGLKTAATA